MRRTSNNISYDDAYQMNEKENSPAEEEINGPETKNGIIVNALNVKIRKEPSFESGTIGVVRKGDKVTILEKLKEFYKVSTEKNGIGYISLDFIKEE